MKKITKISKISLFAGLIYFLSFNQVFGQDNLKGITTQAEYITANPLPNTISAKAGQEFQGNIDEKYKEQERVKYKEIEAQIEKAIEQRYKDAISNGQGNNAQTECTTYINGVCEQDYDALVALYNSTNGPNWSNNTNWLVAGQPVSAWYGIQVQNGRVWSIQLQSNGLNGTLPIEIGNLTNLKYLWLQGNQLSGLLPVELGNLSLLQEMWLGNNSFSGQIPVSIGNLTHLTRLSLSRNQLTGTIPLQLGNLFNLLTIDFSGNRLTGNIPAELGNLTNLIYVFLRENQLSGQIPLTFSSLTYLNVLDLQFNQLSGSIPTFITNFNNLQRLILRNNQLTGTIPAELGNLNNLEELNLAWNQLTGNIPAELGNLTSLQWLQLGINQLSGNIPPELGNLITLRFLNLNNNQLTGPVPSSFANLVSIETIYLRNNSFSFLPNLSALPNLYWYAVDLNKLDFDDIETNIRSGIDFIYAPQDSIGQLLNMNVLQGTSLTLTVTVGGANNSYQWTKNGVDIPGATDPIYTIASATSQDQGSYRCRITNTVATQLTLYSRVNSVTVPAPPCPGIPTVTYEGKTYNTVQIGTQCWLKENLNVGTKINGHDNQIDNVYYSPFLRPQNVFS